MRRLPYLAALLFAVLILPVEAGDNWPGFRGGPQPTIAEEATLPINWDKKTNVAWKADIPGDGWSSPVVWGRRVFVTSALSDAKGPEHRKGLYIQDLDGKVLPGQIRWLLTCLDRDTGKTMWQREAFKGPGTPLHIKNTHASETPVVDGERVYAYFGNVGLACFDFDGKEQWKHKWPVYKTMMNWGTAASPVVADGRLYVINDNDTHSFLACLDARTGGQLWEINREEKSNWATPFIWRNDRRTELVTAGTNRVRSYDLNGKLLWEIRGMTAPCIPTPFAHGGLLYVTSGYVMSAKLRPIYAIRPGAEGDISPPAGMDGKPIEWLKDPNPSLAWYRRLAGPYHPTPLASGDYLYVLLDRGTLTCYDARTGEIVYEKQRLGPNAFTASPWGYSGKIFCLSEDGDTIVVQAGKDFKVLGKNSLDEMAMATPAIAGGSLFLRTQSKLYCLRQDGTRGEKKPNE
jgi:outer membrane protein assembly factor BamB